METNDDVIKALISHCSQRGGAAEISSKLGVAKSTVSRWLDEKSVPEAMQKLLRLYFYGQAPFTHHGEMDKEEENRINITFTDAEYDLIAEAARLNQEGERSFIRRAAIARAREVNAKSNNYEKTA